jgi:hypothetical protein
MPASRGSRNTTTEATSRVNGSGRIRLSTVASIAGSASLGEPGQHGQQIQRIGHEPGGAA